MTEPVGSEAWTNGARYEGKWHARLQYMVNSVSENAICAQARTVRGGNLACAVSKNFSAGNYNIVRRVIFDDGVSWIVRVRLPALEQADWESLINDSQAALPRFSLTTAEEYAMQSEIATMNLVSIRTNIAIPKIHDYSATYDNSLGFPYMFMDYVAGITAFDLATTYGNPLSIPPAYQSHFFAQVAHIMVQLASIRFNAIGSVTVAQPTNADSSQRSPHGQGFRIGPCADTYTGPYLNADSFYGHYPGSLALRLNIKDTTSAATGPPVGTGIAKELEKLIPHFSDTYYKSSTHQVTPTSYPLVNLELGTHNILVDNEFNILSVIDWDSTFAFPLAAAHMFPFCCGAEPGVPGAAVEVSPICPPLDDERAAICIAFVRAVESAARAYNGDLHGQKAVEFGTTVQEGQEAIEPVLTVEGYSSKEARAFRSLMFLKAKQDWVDKAWVPGLQWLLAN